jgi:RND family efflux transporter MFP subunit
MGWHGRRNSECGSQGAHGGVPYGYFLQQGGYVKQGDVLFLIDSRPFAASLDQAKGQLQEAQATLLGVELDAKRAKELFQQNVISEQEYTNKTQVYQTKLAAVAVAQAAVEQAQLNLDYTKVVSPLNGIAGQQEAQIGDLVHCIIDFRSEVC